MNTYRTEWIVIALSVLLILLSYVFGADFLMADPSLFPYGRILAAVLGTALILCVLYWRRRIRRPFDDADNSRYRLLLRHFPDGSLVMVDRDLRVQVAEGSEPGIFRQDPDHLIGLPAEQALDPALYAGIGPDIRSAVDGGAAIREIPIGRDIYRAHCLPIRSESGAVIAGLLLVQRITDLRQATAAASLHRTLFDTFMAHVPAIVFMKDRDLRYRFVNKRWEEQFNHQAAEVEGRLDHQIWPADTAEQFVEHDLRVIADRRAYTITEIAYVDGRQRYFNVTKFPIFDESGLVSHIGGIAIELPEPFTKG